MGLYEGAKVGVYEGKAVVGPTVGRVGREVGCEEGCEEGCLQVGDSGG